MRPAAAILAAAAALALSAAPWAPAGADTAPGGMQAADSFPSPTAAPLARIGAAVAATSALGWGLAVFARRRRVAQGKSGAQIEVVARRSLGPRHHVAVIEVAGQRLLIGMAGDCISTLASLSDGLRFDEMLDERLPRPAPAPPAGIVDLIGRFEGLDG